MRKPARTIAWSSATSTRMVTRDSTGSGNRARSTKPHPSPGPASIVPP